MRKTKYTTEIRSLLGGFGHATNAQLTERLRMTYPELSATTVHRATARLLERGLIGEAPPASDGSMRYDWSVSPHDHFICKGCDRLRDIDVAGEVVPIIQESIGGCKITGRLVISGRCENCIKEKVHENNSL